MSWTMGGAIRGVILVAAIISAPCAAAAQDASEETSEDEWERALGASAAPGSRPVEKAPETVEVTELDADEQPAPPVAQQTVAKAGPKPADTADDPDEEVVELTPEEGAAGEVEEMEGLITISATRTAILSVITRQDILTLGYRSLEELLRNVVGFGVNQNGHWPDTGVRGINSRTTYGDKIQFLLDGHDMSWRQFNRNYFNPTWVDIDEISRVEIIRGPGSALWGANALNGVVSIVTRDWTNLNSAELVLGADHRMVDRSLFARAGTTIGPVSLYTSFSYYEQDADSLLAPLLEFERLTPQRTINVGGDEEHGLNLNIKAKYKWLRLWFKKSRYSTGAPLSTFSVVGGDDSRFIHDRHILMVGIDKMLAVGLDLRVELFFDDYRFRDGTVYEDNPGAATAGDPVSSTTERFLQKMEAVDRRYNLKAQLSYLPTISLQGLLGAEFEFLDLVRWHFPEVWRAQGLALPTFTNWHTGVYAQAQYSPWQPLGLTAGARFDYDERYGAVVTPRAGVVYHLPLGLSIKGLFGVAYKAPSFHDLYYFRKNAFYGNPNLETERAYTGEGQVVFQRRLGAVDVDVRVSGFYTRINNLIGYATREAGTPLSSPESFPESQRPDAGFRQKTNLSFVTTTGVEAEAIVQLFRRVTLRGHGTYRLPRDDQGERLPYSSEWTAGGSVTVGLHEHLDATFRALVVGDKPVPARALNEPGFPSWEADADPTREAPAYYVGTFVLRLKNLLDNRASFQVKLDNVTDTEYWDAGLDVLYPQPGFRAMIWGSLKL